MRKETKNALEELTLQLIQFAAYLAVEPSISYGMQKSCTQLKDAAVNLRTELIEEDSK